MFLNKLVKLLAVLLSLLTFSACAETVTGDLDARFADVPSLEYEGEQYRLRKRLTTILIAGTDTGAASQGASVGRRNGGQADFLLLVVIDDRNRRVTPVQINRDTMTEISVTNVMGDVTGTRIAQLCLAHGFGDGGVESCEFLVSALSNYLKGTPVDHYFVINLEGIPALNDALGGIEVTLEDDFTAYDPEMTSGRTLVLKGEQASIYLRERYFIGDQSNVSRIDRQKTYMNAAAKCISERVESNSGFLVDLLSAAGSFAVTDMSKGRILNYLKAASEYHVSEVRSIEGTAFVGESGFMEFYHDEASLHELLIDVFYETTD